jgi:hypothetical protein
MNQDVHPNVALIMQLGRSDLAADPGLIAEDLSGAISIRACPSFRGTMQALRDCKASLGD